MTVSVTTSATTPWCTSPRCLRSNDLFCRLGGEEFAILLPGSTAAQAYAIADSLRERQVAEPLPVEGDALCMTLSAGVAGFGADGQSLHELMQAITDCP